MTEICLRFKPAIYKIASKYKDNRFGLTLEDLMQIGYLGLIKAHQTYNESKNNTHSFNTHAFNNIIWSIKTELIRNSKKYNSDISIISLDTPIGEENITIGDTIQDDICLFKTVIDTLDIEEYVTEFKKTLQDPLATEIIKQYVFFDNSIKHLSLKFNIPCDELKERIRIYKYKLSKNTRLSKIYLDAINNKANISEYSVSAEKVALHKLKMELLLDELSA